ncbi:glycerol-3-phosphate dehydrogenase/oxidase [Salinicoccus jeotgali]|uniref:Glycerol-3-phosphate dehydrogenase n=1 Tax=Salinicoccus jeotgali TaxID=381634 RepID=A0ABP7F9G3_9STAP
MFNTLTRKDQLQHMEKVDYDIVVIGGGITGAGIALDAAKRGMKVALVEMQDFAEGTSSRSTKLVHGGLRYLKQFQVGIVRETGLERAIVYENGPHVTTPEWMLLPFHKGGTFGKTTTSIGLRVYDMLAEVKKNEQRKMLSVDKVLEKEPLVRQEGLLGGGYYVEYKTDDARMTLEVMKKAAEFGADPINHVKAAGFVYDNGKVVGIHAEDNIGGGTYQILGRRVINAGGPWVDEVRSMDTVSEKGKKQLYLSKGVHLVFSQEDFPLRQAVYFDAKSDGRMIFAIPRDGKTYVGTTDTHYEGDKQNPVADEDDRKYVLDAANYMFPGLDLDESNIESTWAGIRPLILEEGKDPSEISRKDEIWEAESDLITIAGGKLTGYRHMAEEIVDLVAKRLSKEYGLKFNKADTKNQPMSGGDVGGSEGFDDYVARIAERAPSYGLSITNGQRLANHYGSNTEHLFEIAGGLGEASDHYNLPKDVHAQVIYSIQHEMANTPLDYFVRRTGDLYFEIAQVDKYKDGVIELMADILDYDEDRKKKYAEDLEQACREVRGETSVGMA